MDTDRSTPHPDDTTLEDDGLDTAIIAADDTGMLSGERLITVAEIAEADHSDESPRR